MTAPQDATLDAVDVPILVDRKTSEFITEVAANACVTPDQAASVLAVLSIAHFAASAQTAAEAVSETTQRLIDMLRQRDAAGRAKYGTTLDREDLTHAQWTQHLVEELLDGAGYALRAIDTATPDDVARLARAVPRPAALRQQSPANRTAIPEGDMHRALEWMRDRHAPSSYLDAIEEAIAAYDPARVVADTVCRTAIPEVTEAMIDAARAAFFDVAEPKDAFTDHAPMRAAIVAALAAYDPAKGGEAVTLGHGADLWKVVDRMLVSAYTSAISGESLDMLAARNTFTSAYAEAVSEDDPAHRMWCIVGEEVTTDTMSDLVAQAIEFQLVDADGKIRAEEWVRLRKIVIGPDDDDRLIGMANESMAGIFDRPVVPAGGKEATS